MARGANRRVRIETNTYSVLRSLALACLGFLCVAASSDGSGAEAPSLGFEASYELHSRGMTIGQTRLSLRPLGDGRFVYTSSSNATGLAALIRNDSIVERSKLRFEGDGIRSLGYHYTRDGGRKSRVVSVEFDWAAKEVRNTANGRSWRMAIPDGTLDKLNYLLALMRDLSRGNRHFAYPVADGGKLKRYALEFLGPDNVETYIGQLDTLKMRRSRKGGKRVTTIWCAPALGYLPVKVEHSEPDGEVLVMKLREVGSPVNFPVEVN